MARTVSTALLAAALLAIMAATRSHHFSSLLGPGDATLAAFFLGGLFLRRAAWLGLFLAIAGLVDFLAVQAGTSAWCITPGYALLAPACGALWLAGRLSTDALSSPAGLLRAAGRLGGAVLVFFVISNVGFYAFSDAVAGMDALDYALRVAPYLPGYWLQALAYSGAGLALAHGLARAARAPAAA